MTIHRLASLVYTAGDKKDFVLNKMEGENWCLHMLTTACAFILTPPNTHTHEKIYDKFPFTARIVC